MLHVTVCTDANPYYFSSIYAGLFDLAHRNQIKLDFTYPWSRGKENLNQDDVALWAFIKDPETNHSRKIVIDIQDQSYYFNLSRLEQCDIYFKRSYYLPDVEKLPQTLKKKVVPYGLHYLCRSAHEREGILRILGHYGSHYFDIHKPVLSARHFYSAMSLFRSVMESPRIQEFEGKPEDLLKPIIFFQTRVWTLRKSDENLHQVNEERVAIIRALRDAFGNQFIGGLAPEKQAVKMYPDCLTSEKTDRRSFIGMSNQSLIRVYTRGLHHSMATKLPEYLAAAKCIVSEPLRNQLPVNLEPEKHYLEFSSPEECVVACRRLLSDPELASQMRHDNHAYYLAEVRPDNRMLKCFQRAMKDV